VPDIDIDAALALARAGCPLVQPAALEAARDRGVQLIIRAASADARRTIVFTKGADTDAIRHEDHSRRAAIRA
jgi:aspartokinase